MPQNVPKPEAEEEQTAILSNDGCARIFLLVLFLTLAIPTLLGLTVFAYRTAWSLPL